MNKSKVYQNKNITQNVGGKDNLLPSIPKNYTQFMRLK